MADRKLDAWGPEANVQTISFGSKPKRNVEKVRTHLRVKLRLKACKGLGLKAAGGAFGLVSKTNSQHW